ncbi:MAG: diacylglycerol/lipid kinase family protein [Planctomycetota bacterium]
MNESPTPPKRLLLVCNPIAGGGKGRVRGPELAAALRARGVHAECWFTSARGDAEARARQAEGEGWDGLVALGGDGTVNEVLNGMADLRRPLGFFPLGTANVLACELGLPGRVERAADVLAAGHTRPLAVGRAAGRRFLLFCGVGVDGAVVRRLSEVRNGTLGKRKWADPILHTLWRWPQFTLRATLADGEVLDDLSSVLVTRVRDYGGVLKLPPEVSPDSGVLHVLAFRQRSRLAWLWLGLRGVTRTLRGGGDLQVRATTAVRIDGAAPYQLDGDLGGAAPVDVALEPQAVPILAPAPRR